MERFKQVNKVSFSLFMLATILIPAILAMQCNPISDAKKESLDRYNFRLSTSPMAEFYVSPAGNDLNNGTSSVYPFQTIGRAQQAVRAKTSAMTGDIIVHLSGGTYYITNTITFNSSDGGSGPYKVIYEASPGETPVIDGGFAIPSSAWQIHDASKNIWRAHVGTGFDFRQCYITTATGQHENTPTPNDPATPQYPYGGTPLPISVETPTYDGSGKWERRAIRASAAVPQGTFSTTDEGHGYLQASGFWSDLSAWQVPDGNTIANEERYAQDMEFVYHLSWNLPRVHPYFISNFQGQNPIVMQQPAFSLARTKGGTQIGTSVTGSSQPAWIENAYALISKGQWYFDHWTGYLYYMPLDSEQAPNSTTIQFVVPRVETLVNVNGTQDSKVSNLEFNNISFKHANWLLPNENGVGFIDVQDNVYQYQTTAGQASTMSPGAVMVTWASNITFERCVFSKLGSAGVNIQYASNSIVRGCIFDDLSGTGINVGGFEELTNESSPQITKNITVDDNLFTNIAVEYKGGCAIWAGYVQHCHFDHNLIAGCAYSGISGGWGWSYDLTISHDDSYQYNDITNYMMEMNDGAAIYTLSLQNDTRVEHNLIHDGGGSGLYPDEQTAQTFWEFNVVYRSGNSLQDHSLGAARNGTSIRENVIEHNYFDMLPIIEPDRQQTHIPTNTWSIGVGNNASIQPNATVMANVAGAGLESAYQNLSSNLEQVHKKDKSGLYWVETVNPPASIGNNFLVAMSCVISIAVIAIAGVVMITKKNRFGAASLKKKTRNMREP